MVEETEQKEEQEQDLSQENTMTLTEATKLAEELDLAVTGGKGKFRLTDTRVVI